MPDARPDLTALPHIGTLAPATLLALEEAARVVHIPAGWSPIHKLEPADKAYVVLEGELDVVRGEDTVARLGPGSLAGEMGLVDHRLRNARVTASEPVLVLAWPKPDFQTLREAHPDFDAHVRETVRERHDANDTDVSQ